MGGIDRLLVVAALEMSQRQGMERGEGPRVERAESQAALAPFNRAFCLSGPSEYDAAKNIGKGG